MISLFTFHYQVKQFFVWIDWAIHKYKQILTAKTIYILDILLDILIYTRYIFILEQLAEIKCNISKNYIFKLLIPY